MIVLLLVSCNSIDHKRIEQDSQLLADLNCKAKEIRIQRFELADKVRFTEDTLAMDEFKSDPFYQKRLDSLSGFIKPLTNLTKILSDSIFNIQQRFYTQTYNSAEKKKLLDLAFEKATAKICPDQ